MSGLLKRHSQDWPSAPPFGSYDIVIVPLIYFELDHSKCVFVIRLPRPVAVFSETTTIWRIGSGLTEHMCRLVMGYWHTGL